MRAGTEPPSEALFLERLEREESGLVIVLLEQVHHVIDMRVEQQQLVVDGGSAIGLFTKDYKNDTWHEETVDLSEIAGKLVKLDIAAEGIAGGRLALGDMAIRVSPPSIVAAGGKKKNVVVVLVDTLRADKLTDYAKTRVKTPAFGKFVKESTLFERCQAPSNWTKPSCATVLTGLWG